MGTDFSPETVAIGQEVIVSN